MLSLIDYVKKWVNLQMILSLFSIMFLSCYKIAELPKIDFSY